MIEQELFPVPPARVESLAMVRARESRLFAELWNTARAAEARAWRFSIHYEWLTFALDYLDGAGVTATHYQRSGSELKRQLSKLHKNGCKLSFSEEEDVREVAALCLVYAVALADLARAERRASRRV